jgi:transposase
MVFMPKPYPKEFREGALELVRQGDRSVAAIARDLGIAQSGLRRWVEQDQRDRGERSDGVSSAEREELKALRRENARLKQETEILRKAAAFFAREEIR